MAENDDTSLDLDSAVLHAVETHREPDFAFLDTSIKIKTYGIVAHFEEAFNVISSANYVVSLTITDTKVVESWKNQQWKDIAGCWNRLITEINNIDSRNFGQIVEDEILPTSGVVASGKPPILKKHYRDEITKMMRIRRKISPENALILNDPSKLFDYICKLPGEDGLGIAYQDFHYEYTSNLRSAKRTQYLSILSG